MSLHQEREEPIYHLLSYYNNEALTHGAWLASFMISIFAFMSLSLHSASPSWSKGSFAVLFVLGFLSCYVFGRLLYYAKLVTCLLGTPIVKSFPVPIREVNRELRRLFEEKVSPFNSWWFAWQFRDSFSSSSLFFSAILGFLIAKVLFWLGWLVLKFG